MPSGHPPPQFHEHIAQRRGMRADSGSEIGIRQRRVLTGQAVKARIGGHDVTFLTADVAPRTPPFLPSQ